MGRKDIVQQCSSASLIWLGTAIGRLQAGLEPWENCCTSSGGDAIKSRYGKYLAIQQHNKLDRWGPFEACPDVADALRQLHTWAKGRDGEYELWDTLLCCYIPPDDIIDDLLRRELCVLSLGHMALADRWLWKLSDHVEEAKLTLALRRYINPAWSADQSEEVIYAFRESSWMMETLAGHEGSSLEKGMRFLHYVSLASFETQARVATCMCDWLRSVRTDAANEPE